MSPSRLCRRERRANARKVAEEVAANLAENVGQTETNDDTAIQGDPAQVPACS